MELSVGAKKTKPGSKATARRGAVGSGGRSDRVPVGTLHYIDVSEQPPGASFSALCGEMSLVTIDGAWDDFTNEQCASCADQQWAVEFNSMQKELLE